MYFLRCNYEKPATRIRLTRHPFLELRFLSAIAVDAVPFTASNVHRLLSESSNQMDRHISVHQ